VKGWTEVTRYLRQTDPFHRPITIHPTGVGRLSARHAMDDLSLIDFDMLQTPHGRRDAVAPTVSTVRQSYADTPVMPVINGEASFEMLGDNLPTEWTRRMFWLCMMNGAAGHTYGANGIWQVNRHGSPHGPSPTVGSPATGYGVISWDEAMNLPGSSQVAFGKKLLTKFSWQDFQPHPDWARFIGPAPLGLEGAHWIWFPEGEPSRNAPAEKRFFRRDFFVPELESVERVRLRIAVDNQFVARLNGQLLGKGDSWQTGSEFDNVRKFVLAGTNVLTIEAQNVPDQGPNPAGAIARLEIELKSGQKLTIDTDHQWLASKTLLPDWNKVPFTGAGAERALDLGAYGMGPWGKTPEQSTGDIYGPQSSGLPGSVRITYVPESLAIEVRELIPGSAYRAAWFDPVTGEKTSLPEVKANAAGTWTCQPPSGCNHDWVLILEPQKPVVKR
jgi:hypothetical protein